MAKPHWSEIGKAIIKPSMHLNEESLSMVLGIIGTTIAPWMQFYMQSAVIEKRIKVQDYKFVIWDVVIGGVGTVVVAFFIMVACASTLHVNGIKIEAAPDAAMALKPLAGAMASIVFAMGLFVASIFSATILPLATAFYVCEAFGFEAGIDKKFSQAPQFYGLITMIIGMAVTIILLPHAPLITITIWTQVLNAILLPMVLICMIIIINKQDIMGNYRNNTLQNTVGISTTVVLIVLSGMLFLMPVVKVALKKILP
jgi:Mn2+/Fe2+ NRAMP family transporter